MQKQIDKYFNDSLGFSKAKNIAIALLKETIAFLDEFDIDYFLISGTLLGLVRHNDFIPWDDDIDLIVDSSIVEKLPLIMKKYDNKINFIKKDTIIKTCFPDKVEKLNFKYWTNHLLKKDTSYFWPFIDLFIYKKDERNMEFFGKKWENNAFFPKQKVLFNNILVSIPNNPDIF
jgi:hypothetical protein